MQKKWVVVYDDLSNVWFHSFHAYRWLARIGIFLAKRQFAAVAFKDKFYIGTVGRNASGGILIHVKVNEGPKDA